MAAATLGRFSIRETLDAFSARRREWIDTILLSR
jgi:hypothetical protein